MASQVIPGVRSQVEGLKQMQLAAKQRQQLQKTREFRQKPLTILNYIRSGWHVYAFQIGVGAFAIGFYLWGGWPIASGFFAGMVLATFLRDVGWFRRIVGSWPLTREITDWERVDELLTQSNTPAP